MPVYEFRCSGCQKKFALLLGMTAEPNAETCPHCGSGDFSRLVSRFVRGRDEDARMDEIADRLEGMDAPDSPEQMREVMREMGKAMDDDLSDDIEHMFETDLE